MPKNILLIEDSPTQAAKSKMTLEAKGYSVTIATDGKKGLEKATDVLPDLIVLDVYLPDLNGFDVCKQLKNNLTVRGIPVIMFSNENKLSNMTAAYNVGADYYVVKGQEGERVLLVLVETIFTRMARRMRISA
jgi:DNA-binding response OmpR family regulator